MDKLSLKSEEEIVVMAEGGKKLGDIKRKLAKLVGVGVRASEIEKEAVNLIQKAGGKPSFMMVPGYHWATCVNVNEGIVHGIPTASVIFRKGDVVSIDVGMFYRGFHTDTSITVGVELTKENKKFLNAGREALANAIKEVKNGNYIYDISYAIQKTIEKAGFNPVRALVGHGVGRNLHEDPQIPCFTLGERTQSLKLMVGMTIAIEVMYVAGKPELVREKDGWTISTQDGKISALYEETVAISKHGRLVLTD